MLFNKNQRNRLWIVDDFYQNPYAIRENALKQEYIEGGLGIWAGYGVHYDTIYALP